MKKFDITTIHLCHTLFKKFVDKMSNLFGLTVYMSEQHDV